MDYRVELIEILKNKVTEGLKVLDDITVADRNYGETVLNIITSDKTWKNLEREMKEEHEPIENIENLEMDGE